VAYTKLNIFLIIIITRTYHKTDDVCIHAEKDPQRVKSVCHGAVIGPATFSVDPSRAGRANPCRQLALPNLILQGTDISNRTEALQLLSTTPS
jgi:hypothetical protein